MALGAAVGLVMLLKAEKADDGCGAGGVSLGGALGLVMLPKAENADAGCGAGGFGVIVFVLGKLKPPKASARPPKASGFAAGVDVIPPKDGCRSCCG